MSKKCLIVCYSDLGKDPRVIKHYRALTEAGYEIHTAGVTPIGSETSFTRITQFDLAEWTTDYSQKSRFRSILFFSAVKLLNFCKYKIFRNFYFLRYWNFRRVFDLARLVKRGNVDLIIANDIETLPLAIFLASKRTNIVYDAHEFHEEQHADRQFWIHNTRPMLIYLNRKYLHRATKCITVGENIAAEFLRLYQVSFTVILNAPPFEELQPNQLLAGQKIRLVHPGMYVKNRNIEELIVMMKYLPDNYELHFLLVAGDKVINTLKEKAKGFDNVIFHKSVDVHEVSRYINQFDIGVALIPATTFNYDNALPNKFFQFIQARLVTAFGPLKEITDFTARYNTGIISEGYAGQDLANAIKKLSKAEINKIKENNNVISEIFSEENEIVKLKQIYQKVS